MQAVPTGGEGVNLDRSSLTRRPGRLEGECRKLEALALLEARRRVYVRRGRRALLARLLAMGTATADDVRTAVELPQGVNPKLFGAVPGPLAETGIIKPAAIPQRPERKGMRGP